MVFPEFMGFKQMLLLKILRKQGIMGESKVKPKSRNWTSGGMTGGNG